MNEIQIPWTTTPTCQRCAALGGKCQIAITCRTNNGFRKLAVEQGYQDPSSAVCPVNLPVDVMPDIAGKALAKDDPNKRPPVTPAKVLSFMEAMATAPRVSPEVEAARLAVCGKCDMLKVPTDGTPSYCGMCGCQVSKEGWRIRDMSHYEENLPKWGCKHKLRGYTDPNGNRIGWSLPEQGEKL